MTHTTASKVIGRTGCPHEYFSVTRSIHRKTLSVGSDCYSSVLNRFPKSQNIFRNKAVETLVGRDAPSNTRLTDHCLQNRVLIHLIGLAEFGQLRRAIRRTVFLIPIFGGVQFSKTLWVLFAEG